MIYLTIYVIIVGLTRGNPLVFPGEIAESKLKIPTCTGDTFCESDSNYPKSELKEILSNTKLNVDLFNTGNLTADEMNTRFGDNEGFLCTPIRKTIFPAVAQNVRKEWRVIFNLDNFIQAVRVEICRNTGPCKFFEEASKSIVTQCKQKYIERRLLAVDSSGKTIVEDFLLPASCVCAYKNGFFHRFKTRSSYKPKYGR